MSDGTYAGTIFPACALAAAGLGGLRRSFLAAGVPEDKLIFAPESPAEFASVLTVGSDYLDTDPEVKRLALPAREA